MAEQLQIIQTLSAEATAAIADILPKASNLTNGSILASTQLVTQSPKSSWLIIRLIMSFKNAIEEQSSMIESPSKRINGFVGYCLSPYAAVCMLMAIVLNRTVVFASSRNHKKLPWLSGLVLRVISISILMKNLLNVLVAIKFYTGIQWLPNYLNYDAEYYKDTFMSSADMLVKIVSSSAPKNITTFAESPTSIIHTGPTPNLFWPLYLSLCLSQFLETFIAVTSGQQPYSESGLTLFEHSLAFQEVSSTDSPTVELLIVSLISLLNQASIQVGGIFSNKYRLIPSSILGISFLSFYVYSIFNHTLLNFPIVIIFGYLPQILILAVIALCSFIFALAVICKGSLNDLNFSSFINLDSDNYNIHLYDDFYTALMNLGLLTITSAGKSSYVKELSLIYVKDLTWLEKEYIDEKTGYEKSISSPPSNYIDNGSRPNENYGKRWILVKRITMMKKMFSWLIELILSIILRRKRLPSFMQTKENETKNNLQRQPTRGKEELEIFIDDIDEEILSANYASYLISNSRLSEIDSSLNYEEIDKEESSSELESDIDEGIENIDMQAIQTTLVQRQRVPHTEQTSENMLNELISPQEFQRLMNPSNDNESEFAKTLKYHMNSESNTRLTRSKYNLIQEKDESKKLLELIKNKRHETTLAEEEELSAKLCCVVCHTNPREIILWPCRCFAVCESCRISLVVRGFSGCVCCRRDVDGFSKVFIP